MSRLIRVGSDAVQIVGLCCLLGQSNIAAELPRRIHANLLEDGRTFVLQGNTRPAITRRNSQDQGEVSASMKMPRMALHFAMTSAQRADLEQFLTALQDRRSPQYRKFLTPEQFAARFGMNNADLSKVTSWLENRGFSNLEIARSRTSVAFYGTAAQVEAAFHTVIRKYLVNGEAHFANANDPELPSALQGIAASLTGLHNFRLQPATRLTPRFALPNGGDLLAPDDWETIYDVKPLYGAGWDGSPLGNASTLCGGSPCSLAVVGQSDVQASDLAAFRAAAHLPAKAVTVLIPPFAIDPGFQTGNEGESDLDLEWSNAIAPNANVLFVTTDFTINNGVEDSMAYAIENNVAPIVTMSYGLCEADLSSGEVAARNAHYQQANAQGMTIVAASGDSGGAGCDNDVPPTYKPDYPATLGLAVQFPASSPYVTGVGGTTLTTAGPPYFSTTNNSNNGSALSYVPEDTWNDSFTYTALAASGGGVSRLFAKPSWQSGQGVPNDGQRDVPDIALAASPNSLPYLVCGHSFCANGFVSADSHIEISGGTSAGAPSFAGVLALLVQKEGSPLGNINPNLYTLAQAAPDAFHDILFGSNRVTCVLGTPDCNSVGFSGDASMGYSAGTGYDLATGLGSIDAFNLVEEWAADIQISANPAALTVPAGSSTTATVTVAPLRGFTGPVFFICTVRSGLANVTCSVAGTVNTSGTATLTVTAGSTAGIGLWQRVSPPVIFAGLALLCCTLCFPGKRRETTYAWSTVAAVCVLAAVSCGGGSSGGSGSGPVSVPESGNVIVTATSGQIHNQVVVAVTIP